MLQQELCIECDMRSFHTDGIASIQPTKERCKSILDTLLNCELSNKLTLAVVKELFGKLSFCLQSLFGRVGRASALPLVQQCYNNKDLSFTHDLRQMRRFFKIILDQQHLPKRTFRLGTDNRPPTFIWSELHDQQIQLLTTNGKNRKSLPPGTGSPGSRLLGGVGEIRSKHR